MQMDNDVNNNNNNNNKQHLKWKYMDVAKKGKP